MLMEFPAADVETMPPTDDDSKLSKRQRFAKYVRCSQICLLKKLKQWLTWYD